MKYEIMYKNEKHKLIEDFIDVGHMPKSIKVEDIYGKIITLHQNQANKAMSLFVSFPHAKNGFFKEIEIIDRFMSLLGEDIDCYLIFSSQIQEKAALKNRLNKFKIVFDTQKEFGSRYGTKIVHGNLEGPLTKSLFLISKDGVVFYLDIPQDLNTPLNLERLQMELRKAYVGYTGIAS